MCAVFERISSYETNLNSPYSVFIGDSFFLITVFSCLVLYLIKSSIVPIFISCSSAIFFNSGNLAIEPSSLIISTITEAGSNPASLAKSQPASVWPALVRTPPGCDISGNICPGLDISFDVASGITAVRIVCALSYADMPVVTPSEASIEIVKLVSCFESVSVFIKGKFSCLHLSLVRVKQIRPLAYLLIKFMSSGVTFDAAIIKSPSFSRPSSSTIKTIFPFFRSFNISSVFDNIISLNHC